MTFLHFLVSALFYTGLVFVIIFAIMAAKPSLLKDKKDGLKVRKTKLLTRRDMIIATVVSAMIVFAGLGNAMAATGKGAEQQREARAVAQQLQEKREAEEAERERLRKIEAAKPKVETETKLDAIPYDTIEQEDGSIPRGETRVAIEGIEGTRSVTYEVTYVNGKETDRKEISNEVTAEPVSRVTLVGTYVAPPPVAEVPSSGGSGYVNSQGNFVPSPSDNPAGATAKCRNGTYSYSQSRRGTCSHHGGVAEWL